MYIRNLIITSNSNKMEYNFREVEKKWQAHWAKNKTFKTENNSSKPKYYVLDMFPYPSGAGLHVGHPLGYIASDIYARYKRLKGFNVLHPMGYDSFGLPAEQYAIQTGQHPKITTENNIARYREQLDKIGFSFDWDREVRTSDPAYYKWTQWIFIQLFNSWYNPETNKAESINTLIPKLKNFNGLSEKEQSDLLLEYRLAYLSDTMVNWCPQLGTVLANEEVKDGVSERGGYPVERKLMKQWSLRITAYAERLLNDLDNIDWTESIKEAQRNWIGKSEGTSIRFSLTPNPSPRERGTEPGYHTANKKIWERLKENSRENRNNQTEAEELLWEKVRGSKLGFKIRRQHAIDQFISDFVCLERKLIIEVDGEIHNFQQEYDEGRTYRLEEIGYNVIRFTNDSVKNKIDWVCSEIVKALQAPLSFGEGVGGEAFIEVFTTRPDTIFGVSFVTLAPEHELVEKITTPEQKKVVNEYVTFAKNRSERERQADVKKITGVFTGAYAVHPFTGKQIPIWLGDYVLAGYGTGAVMAVPGHDSRDYTFAKHFDLPIIEVVAGGDLSKESHDAKEGKLINSDFLNGLEVKEAVKRAIEAIEEKNLGKGKTNFRLRDAIFGRQRYWGEPIPVYYKDGIPKVLDEKELPLVLPEVDKYLPTETGEPPLARAASSWKKDGKYEYEHSTMPGWAGSSWYYLRYMDAHNDNTFASKEAVNYWQNVDLYMGGSEHATGHLLYVRFWTKFLNDLGLVPFIEPAKKLINQGMIQGVSKFVMEVRVQATFKSLYDQNDKILNVIKDGKVVLELNVGKLDTWHHVFCNYGSSLTFQFKSEGFTLPTVFAVTHASAQFTAATSIESKVYSYHTLLDGWLRAQPSYRPIVITEIPFEAYWHYENKCWYYFNGIKVEDELQDKPLWVVNSEVEKMSKSKLNVVSPDDNPFHLDNREQQDYKYYFSNEEYKPFIIKGILEDYGADALRLYEMFLGPLELSKPWNTNGISGVSNFIRKLWRLYHCADWNVTPLLWRGAGGEAISSEPATKPELKVLHKTIKKIVGDIENFSFNTSISNFMICVNELTELKCNKREILEPLAIIIAPYAPHIAEELWEKLGHKESVTYATFPIHKEEYLVESAFNYPISFNGKTRFFQEYDLSLSKEDIEKEVLGLEQTQKYLEGKTPKKIIVVHNKIVNIVV